MSSHSLIPQLLTRKRLLPLLVAALVVGPQTVYAIDLGTAFAMAKNNDPKYQAAKAEMDATKSQAVELAKFELMQALSTSNYNGRFDGVLMAMGQVPAPKIETSNEPQLSLF